MYRVLIYHHDEIVEDKKFKTIEEATKYGEMAVREKSSSTIFDGGYWFKVKVD